MSFKHNKLLSLKERGDRNGAPTGLEPVPPSREARPQALDRAGAQRACSQ